jgi:hypothetical protein
MAIEWKKRRGELVATAYGREIAVRRAGRRFSAHYGPDRWVIGDFNSRYKTEETAKAAAIRYAKQSSDSGQSIHSPEKPSV